jgi:hypothetical protein
MRARNADLSLNLKTTKRLGLDVSNKLPALADEAIEQDFLLLRPSPLLAHCVISLPRCKWSLMGANLTSRA